MVECGSLAAGSLEVDVTVLPLAPVQGPSWFWYATRGLGLSTLVVLTLTLVLGIVTSGRWRSPRIPGFVVADLHRNLSLVSIGLLLAHIVTTLADPYAHIGLRDVIIPFAASYRPVWLGLGQHREAATDRDALRALSDLHRP